MGLGLEKSSLTFGIAPYKDPGILFLTQTYQEGQLHPGMPFWPSAGGGREQDDGQAVIAAGEGVPPPASHSHSAEQHLQQQTDTP